MPPRSAERPALPVLTAFVGTALILAGQASRLSPLTDAVDAGPFESAGLGFPAGYVLSAPFSALADLLTFSSASQAAAWLAWIAASYWVLRAFRPARSLGSALAGWAAWSASAALFLAWALLFPRPIATIVFDDPRLAALDFHSHSSCSHDGRGSFSPMENAAWHGAAGFRAGFLTDHNSDACSRVPASAGGADSLHGIELSLHGAHVVALSPHGEIPLARYQAGQAGLEAFLREASPVFGAAPILSLPEYWRHHRAGLADLAGHASLPAGIEVANGAPKALQAQDEARPSALSFARARGMFPACATDNHGWAQAPYCWNVMSLPGHQDMSPPDLEAAVMASLRSEGFDAVRVVERRRVRTSAGWRAALDPLLGLWVLARTLSPLLAAASLAWLWALCAFFRAAPALRPSDKLPASRP
ncbi:MAG: hypothetical protein HY928_14310 [Elusimicrobia bacterium]|nr:hypothetical protein [Elusimicrobiota bacterium]